MYSTARILEILKDSKADLQKRYPISELGLFGSYARGDFNEQSDIDILVDLMDASVSNSFHWHMSWRIFFIRRLTWYPGKE